MKTNCAGCKHEISSTTRRITCVSCDAAYHPICVNLTLPDLSKVQDWQCPECQAKQPKKDNSLTHVSGVAGTPVRAGGLAPTAAGATPRATKRPAIGSPNTSLTDKMVDPIIATELRLLREEMAELKSFITEGLSRCFEKLENFECRIKIAEENALLVPQLQETIAKMQEQLEHHSQSALSTELEIMGVEENSNENLTHILLVAATKVGVNLVENDIDRVSRAGPKTRANLNSQESPKDATFPRPVIVRFTRKAKRDELLRGAKNRRNMSSTDLDVQGPDRKIYFNEHLTKSNRMLFRDARACAKEHDFRFCWVSNGRILIRKREGKSAITIRNSADLEKLRASAAN